MEKFLRVFTFVCVGFVFGMLAMFFKPIPVDTIHVSKTALFELNMACSGDYQEVSVSNDYLYSSCRNGKPVTIQNYIFK